MTVKKLWLIILLFPLNCIASGHGGAPQISPEEFAVRKLAAPYILPIFAINEKTHEKDAAGNAIAIEQNYAVTSCDISLATDLIIIGVNEKPYEAKQFYADSDKNFCIVEIHGATSNPVKMRSAATLKDGEGFYVLHEQDGNVKTLFRGQIVQKNPPQPNELIQTNIAFDAETSADGLFDAKGNLLGITTDKSSATDPNTNVAVSTDLILQGLAAGKAKVPVKYYFMPSSSSAS